MKRFLQITCLIAVACLLNGCAFMSDEDKDFYGKGWVKPTELDEQYPHHAGTPKGNPVETAVGAPVPPSDSEWDTSSFHPQ